MTIGCQRVTFHATRDGILLFRTCVNQEGFHLLKIPKEDCDDWDIVLPEVYTTLNTDVNTQDIVHISENEIKSRGVGTTFDAFALMQNDKEDLFYAFPINIATLKEKFRHVTDGATIEIVYLSSSQYDLNFIIDNKNTSICHTIPLEQFDDVQGFSIPSLSFPIKATLNSKAFYNALVSISDNEAAFVTISITIHSLKLCVKTTHGCSQLELLNNEKQLSSNDNISTESNDSQATTTIDSSVKYENKFRLQLLLSYASAHKLSEKCDLSMDQDLLIIRYDTNHKSKTLGYLTFCLSPYIVLSLPVACSQLESLKHVDIAITNKAEIDAEDAEIASSGGDIPKRYRGVSFSEQVKEKMLSRCAQNKEAFLEKQKERRIKRRKLNQDKKKSKRSDLLLLSSNNNASLNSTSQIFSSDTDTSESEYDFDLHVDREGDENEVGDPKHSECLGDSADENRSNEEFEDIEDDEIDADDDDDEKNSSSEF